jgi:phosphoglycolate phosphatase-like HAD superfamily hydrolase
MTRALVVFDMDGVLIDVSGSYREAVRQTARLFFSRSNGYAELPDFLLPLEDSALLKQSGGLNSDGDLTAQALSLLCSTVTPTAEALRDDPSAESVPRFDVRGQAVFLRTTPLPFAGLLTRHGRLNDRRIAACHRGDVADGSLIKGLFQEIYLGHELFSRIHGRESRFWDKAGLIETERLLVERPLLEELARGHLLATATGRPRIEAEVTWHASPSACIFQQVLTLDDCTAAGETVLAAGGERVSLSKPHPSMLDAIARPLAGRFGKCLYLGDMPDDREALRLRRLVVWGSASSGRRRNGNWRGRRCARPGPPTFLPRAAV